MKPPFRANPFGKTLARIAASLATGSLCSSACLGQAGGGAANRGVESVLIDRSLSAERCMLLKVEIGEGGGGSAAGGAVGGRVTYLDVRGTVRTRDIDELAAIAPLSWPVAGEEAQRAMPSGVPDGATPASAAKGPAPVVPGWIELANGERLTGSIGGAANGPASDAGGDTILWRHDRLGEVRISLDEVRRIVLRPMAPDVSARPASSAGSTTDDTLWLVNGDVLTGLVELINGSGVTIDTGGGKDDAIRVALEQASEIRLVNEPRPPEGVRGWMRDGTIIGIAGLTMDPSGTPAAGGGGGRATLRASIGGTASIDLADLVAINFHADQLISLSEIAIARQERGTDRRWSEPAAVVPTIPHRPPALDSSDILLPGPMSVEWILPMGTKCLGGWARLDGSSGEWGDCLLIVSVVSGSGAGSERILAEARLNQSQSGVMVRAELPEPRGSRPGDRLRVRVESGEHGPIQDRVVLQNVLLGLADGTN